MKTLEELRLQIDSLDQVIAEAYAKRLDCVRAVGRVKKEFGTEILQSVREKQVIERAVAVAGEKNRGAVTYLYREIMDYSKEEQLVENGGGADFLQSIDSLTLLDGSFGEGRIVACQGIAGAFTHLAAEELFQKPNVLFYDSWDKTFAAVLKGDADFGVLPIENSTAGSVNEVYDLLKEYGLTIVAAKKLKVSHCLLGVKGAALSDIKTVCSHAQALWQCKHKLERLKIFDRKETLNTAIAARDVALLNDASVAAVASRIAAQRYGLTILQENLQDSDQNHTRFIVVSKEKAVLKDGNKISVVLSLEHKEGALHRLLGIFAAAGKNLIKLESRPVPEKQFEFLFYVDLEANILQPETREMLRRVGAYCASCTFLGGYKED